jgi:hypothetical protein
MHASDIPGENGMPDRLSLRKIDSLLQGELPEAEAAALRARIDGDAEARAYLDRQTSLRSGLTEASLRAELRRRAPGKGRTGPPIPAGWGDRLKRFRDGLSGARGQAAAVIGALACLTLGLTLWTGRIPQTTIQETYRSKGTSEVEVTLRHNGNEYAPGELISARTGDTLILTYRGEVSLRGQVWIQEDEGDPVPLQVRDFPLPPVTAWTELPQRILLEGAWSRQQLWILLSPRTLGREAAKEAVSGGKIPEGARVLAYRLSAST